LFNDQSACLSSFLLGSSEGDLRQSLTKQSLTVLTDICRRVSRQSEDKPPHKFGTVTQVEVDEALESLQPEKIVRARPCVGNEPHRIKVYHSCLHELHLTLQSSPSVYVLERARPIINSPIPIDFCNSVFFKLVLGLGFKNAFHIEMI
jgi:hypothetical protein